MVGLLGTSEQLTVGEQSKKLLLESKDHFLCPIYFSCAKTHFFFLNHPLRAPDVSGEKVIHKLALFNPVLGNECILIRKQSFYCQGLGFILTHVSIFYWAINVLLQHHNPNFGYFAKVSCCSILLRNFPIPQHPPSPHRLPLAHTAVS